MSFDRSVAGRPHAPLALSTRLLCLFVLILAVAASPLAAPGSDAVSSPTGSPSAATDVPLREVLAKNQEELAERRHRVEQALSRAESGQSTSKEVDAVRNELEVLKYYELVCAQHREELVRTEDLREEHERWQAHLHGLRLAGPEEPRPYSVLLLDDVEDQIETEQSFSHTLSAELASAKDLQNSTERMHNEADTARRKTKELLESERSQSRRTALAKQLDLDQLRGNLFDEMLKLRRTEIANKEVARQISAIRLEYLTEKKKAISGKVLFTREHLETVISELDKYEEELRVQLPQLQSRLQETETRAFDVRKQQASSGEDALLTKEREEGWQLAKRGYQLQIKMIHQRIRELVLARLGWNLRHKVFNGEASREQLDEWREDVDAYLEKVRASRQVLEGHSKVLMVELGRKEKKVRALRRSNAEASKWVEFQIAGLHELSQAYASNLVQVETVERMLAKLSASLSQGSEPSSARDWLSMLLHGVATAWNYELASVDDRPITVKKVVSGLLLMLLGFYLSRRLSRLIGNRMLPRMGMNGGVATAVQSISFYLLVTCFALVSLELINIPITVFAFLGGAVAIGVGFGSQNILNNFISGLILLAEQPIRVGDLVDIGGLCGNVEKIGARSTRVKTGANLEIIVPNSKFLEDNVTNWTLSDTRMRTTVSVGVAYGSPTKQVDALLHQAVAECPNTLSDPQPIILFNEFGDNALTFEVHFWIFCRTMMQARKIESELRHTIDQLMRDADITIAFPQRDVHLDAVRPIEVNVRQLAEDQGFQVRRTKAA